MDGLALGLFLWLRVEAIAKKRNLDASSQIARENSQQKTKPKHETFGDFFYTKNSSYRIFNITVAD
jgi:hypothetical protein